MAKFVFILFSAFVFSASAKNLSSHVHGLVRLEMAYEKNELLIMLSSPAESFLGFEYKAKTKKELELLTQVKKDWKKDIIKLFGEKTLNDCKISSTNWEQKFSGERHSSIHAEAYIKCKKLLAGRNLEVTLKRHYNNIETINLQLIRNDGTVDSRKVSEELFTIKL